MLKLIDMTEHKRARLAALFGLAAVLPVMVTKLAVGAGSFIVFGGGWLALGAFPLELLIPFAIASSALKRRPGTRSKTVGAGVVLLSVLAAAASAVLQLTAVATVASMTSGIEGGIGTTLIAIAGLATTAALSLLAIPYVAVVALLATIADRRLMLRHAHVFTELRELRRLNLAIDARDRLRGRHPKRLRLGFGTARKPTDSLALTAVQEKVLAHIDAEIDERRRTVSEALAHADRALDPQHPYAALLIVAQCQYLTAELRYDAFARELARRLSPTELTFERFLGAARTVYLGVCDRLTDVSAALALLPTAGTDAGVRIDLIIEGNRTALTALERIERDIKALPLRDAAVSSSFTEAIDELEALGRRVDRYL